MKRFLERYFIAMLVFFLLFLSLPFAFGGVGDAEAMRRLERLGEQSQSSETDRFASPNACSDKEDAIAPDWGLGEEYLPPEEDAWAWEEEPTQEVEQRTDFHFYLNPDLRDI